MFIEISYLVLIIVNFSFVKYLISIHLFLSKVIQSIFLVLFHIITLIIFLNSGPGSIITPSKSLQTKAMWCIMVSMLFEYLFLIINVVWLVKNLIQKKKKGKNAGKNPYVRYVWLKKKYLNRANLNSTTGSYGGSIAKVGPGNSRKKKKLDVVVSKITSLDVISKMSKSKKKKKKSRG